MGTFGDPLAPMGAYGDLPGPMGTYGVGGINFLHTHFDTNPPPPFPPSIRSISDISHILLSTLQKQHAISDIGHQTLCTILWHGVQWSIWMMMGRSVQRPLPFFLYHVQIVNGHRNHFPNTMFGGVLLWTLIEVLLRNMRSLYALWRQKTPLTNGQVREAKSHCRKIAEAWLKLGWKSTPWVHWTAAHCGAVLQKYLNLYLLSSIPAEHRHQPFKLAVKNSMHNHDRVSPMC